MEAVYQTERWNKKEEYKVRTKWPYEEKKREMRSGDGVQMSVSALRERRHEEDEDESLREEGESSCERGDVREVCSLLSLTDNMSLLYLCG